MRDRIYRTEALILRRNDFGEADRLLLVATPGGKQRIIAKGVRKTTSRLAGSVELFTHVTLLLAVGRNLDIVTQGQVHQHFPNLHASLERLGCAYYTAELYDQFVQDEQDHRPAFRLLVDTFAALDTSRNPDLILRAYELHLLHVDGYRPQLQRCVVSHELLTEEASLFSPMLGGVLAPSQNDADRNALPMSLSAFKLLRYLQTQPYATIERMNLSGAVRNEVAGLLHSYLARLLDRELKSTVLLEELYRQSVPSISSMSA
ncbi:MAG: DNA repair protein RecO [Blastochloris sp.]|nr:DNA repair protein RecO [Blastochloris sp.]